MLEKPKTKKIIFVLNLVAFILPLSWALIAVFDEVLSSYEAEAIAPMLATFSGEVHSFVIKHERRPRSLE